MATRFSRISSIGNSIGNNPRRVGEAPGGKQDSPDALFGASNARWPASRRSGWIGRRSEADRSPWRQIPFAAMDPDAHGDRIHASASRAFRPFGVQALTGGATRRPAGPPRSGPRGRIPEGLPGIWSQIAELPGNPPVRRRPVGPRNPSAGRPPLIPTNRGDAMRRNRRLEWRSEARISGERIRKIRPACGHRAIEPVAGHRARMPNPITCLAVRLTRGAPRAVFRNRAYGRIRRPAA